MKDLRDISKFRLRLISGSLPLAVRQRIPDTTVIGYSRRAAVRARARDRKVTGAVADDLEASVSSADPIIQADPTFTSERDGAQLSELARSGRLVTDLGSTNALPRNGLNLVGDPRATLATCELELCELRKKERLS